MALGATRCSDWEGGLFLHNCPFHGVYMNYGQFVEGSEWITHSSEW